MYSSGTRLALLAGLVNSGTGTGSATWPQHGAPLCPPRQPRARGRARLVCGHKLQVQQIVPGSGSLQLHSHHSVRVSVLRVSVRILVVTACTFAARVPGGGRTGPGGPRACPLGAAPKHLTPPPGLPRPPHLPRVSSLHHHWPHHGSADDWSGSLAPSYSDSSAPLPR